MTAVGSQSAARRGVRPLFPRRNGHRVPPIGGVATEAPPHPGQHIQWRASSLKHRGRGAGAQVQLCASRSGGRGATSAVRGLGVGGARAPSSQREGCGKSRPENGRRRRCRAERRRRRRRGGETVSGTAAAAGGDPCWGAGGRGGTWRGRGPRGRATRLADGVPPLYPPPPAGDGTPPPRGGPLPALAGDRLRRGLLRLPLPASPHPPAFGAHPGPPAPRAPLSPGLRLSGLRARRALRGASGPRRRRAPAPPASPWLALSRLPPSRAPLPLLGPPHWRACAVLLPSGECATRAPGQSPPSPGFASPSFSPIP